MENYNSVPTICIVGRPNVGKSSLFNCLLGERRAVVVEQSGTTRDRLEAIITVEGAHFKLVDTGGYLSADTDGFSKPVKEQIYRAMEEAAVIILVTDTIAGATAMDKEVALILRKFGKPVILAANKTDNDKLKTHAFEFYQLGFGEPINISCLHRRGIKALKKKIAQSFKSADLMRNMENPEKIIKVAVVGRPNVGKSSFVNNLLARNRVLVSDIPGTTRDSIDTHFKYKGEDYLLIDTAGIRHKRKIKTAVDTYSVMRSKESILRADVVFLLLDAACGVTKDDLGILKLIDQAGKAALVLVNKWDLSKKAEEVTMEEYAKHLLYAANELSKFPLEFISARSGRNVLRSLEMASVLDSNLDLEASTPYLNRIFKKNDPSQVPIPRKKKRPNFLYIVQSGCRPVEFKYFVNDPHAVLPSHISYIENQLRANLPLKGIPIKVRINNAKKR
ncbi:MAG: ribosome biogenesis GTPase Der [Candidatus Omnitrophica bacterium]|nr:ribosome biogenesis GTPase Der [Candidatus Omnitrophota bacterium]